MGGFEILPIRRLWMALHPSHARLTVHHELQLYPLPHPVELGLLLGQLQRLQEPLLVL